MDLDPSIYYRSSSPEPTQVTPETPSSPLPRITLPTLPRPSVSPASTRVSFTQQQKSGRTSAGLDLSASMQGNYSNGNSNGGGTGGGNSLEDDVARARAERTARRNMTSSFDSESAPTSPNPTSPSSDPRDSASARDNILNLVSAGQKQSGNSSTPSLAMFMGGGTNRRIHKVNQEMTEQEREVTEKLEKEMEATRAKWGNKQEESPAPRSGGFSLASLMNKQVGGSTSSSSTQDDEPKRWQPSAASPPLASSDPIRSQTAPASSKVPSSQPASSTTPRSLASAFGSTANGPRLNSASQAPADEQDGPVHARSGGGFAMPGLAKEKTEESRPQETKKENSTPLVEPKVFSRPAPSPAEPAQAPPVSSPTKIAFPSISPNDSPSKTASTTQNSTLGRLRGSSLVAERLKFAEQLQQQSSSPLASPTKERGSTTTSPEKRRSVMDRWNRDQPNSFGNSAPASPTKSSTLPPPKSPGFTGNSSPWSASARTNVTTAKEEENQLVKDEEKEKNESEPAYTSQPTFTARPTSYSKPLWEHAPIGVKPVSKSSFSLNPDEETPYERKSTRGVALPGMGVPSSTPSLPPSSSSTIPPPSPEKQKTDPLPTSSSGGVRAAAMKWGRTDSDAQREKLEELKRLKESYGVKVSQSDAPRSTKDTPARSQPQAQPKPVQQKEQSKPKPAESKPASTPAPSQPRKIPSTSSSSSNPLVNEIVSLALTPRSSPSLSGELLSLDVFHLNSPTDNPHPIEHNHILHSTEILGIVVRTATSESEEDVETNVWVWRGRDAEETARTRERIEKLAKKTGVNPVEVGYRQEPKALVEAFEGQLTICKGLREDFDHLEKRLFIVQSEESVVFVEETDLSAKSLCSGYCAVLSLPGEVYAWLGEGSTSIEREACCQFAESIADGRSVNVLAEGEETQWFWHSLDDEDNVEYASANYWHRQPESSPPATLLKISSSSASLASSLDPTSIFIVDGGSLEHFVVVPEQASLNTIDIKTALEAVKVLSEKWEERGFESKTPAHVIVFPSRVPRDLPFLSRSLDFESLNNGKVKKMNVYTLEEAKKELL